MLAVIVVAAGQGSRMEAQMNKLLLPLAGEPLLCRTLQRLQSSPAVDELIVVAHPQERELWQQMGLMQRYPRLSAIISGGATRSESVRAGLKQVHSAATWVAIHDGARPVVSQEELSRLWERRHSAQSAILALMVQETVKRAQPGESRLIAATIPREGLWLAQTPQLFPRDLILEAYARFPEGTSFTDDASLVEALGYPVQLVPGSPDNIKVTTPGDLERAEAIWHRQEGLP